MSNYSKTTDFSSKDALTTGSANKIVKGIEIDDEFDAIQVAIATKANTNSPTLTGTPTVPTAAADTNTTQIASTAFVDAIVTASAAATRLALYPVGSIYTNASVSTNPATLLGFGTWTAFGSGRVVVGVDAADTAFNTLGETGGSADAINVAHTHGVTDPSHRHQVGGLYGYSNGSGNDINSSVVASSTTSLTSFSATGVTVNSAGASGVNANLQPYITVYMWKRTA